MLVRRLKKKLTPFWPFIGAFGASLANSLASLARCARFARPSPALRSQACLVLAGSDPKGFELGPSKKVLTFFPDFPSKFAVGPPSASLRAALRFATGLARQP